MMIGLILTFGAFANVRSQICPSVDWNTASEVINAFSLQVTCADTYMEVTVNTCFLTAVGFDPDNDLTVNGASGVSGTCADLVDNFDAGASTWTGRLNEPFNDCGTTATLSADGEVMVYSNAVALFAFSNNLNEAISRKRFFYLDFSCNYTVKYSNVGLQGSDAHNFSVIQDPQRADLESETGEYNYSIRGCLEDPCASSEIQPGSEVTIMDDINIIIDTTRNINVYILEVIAQDAETNPTNTYTIVEAPTGCLASDELADGATVTSTLGKVVLQFRAFQWASDLTGKLYLRVTFQFCDPDVEPSCVAPCSARRRRRSALPYHSDRATTTTILGPWKTV